MRAGLIAAGLVGAALAGSLGIVFAQRGDIPDVLSLLPPLPWAESESTGVAPQPILEPQSRRSVLSPVSDAVVVAEVGGAASAAGTATDAKLHTPLIPTTAAMPAADPSPKKVSQLAAQATPAPSAAPPPAAAPPPPPPPSAPTPADVMKGPPCTNPNALGVSRVVEIDTTGAPGFGFEHFKQHDFLRDGEVVLTFDDGPWLRNTPAVLKALADQCVKATFFPIGKHISYYPEILRQVAKAGHTIGSHTWSHKDLSKMSLEEAKVDIEKGVSALKLALGQPITPFFRFPALKHPPKVLAYLAERNVGVFSTDIDSFDFKIRRPNRLVKGVMAKLKKRGKGILLMHDFQRGTAKATPELLAQLKANGYKIVHLTAKDRMDSLPKYDEMLAKEQKLSTAGGGRPTSSVVKTVAE